MSRAKPMHASCNSCETYYEKTTTVCTALYILCGTSYKVCTFHLAFAFACILACSSRFFCFSRLSCQNSSQTTISTWKYTVQENKIGLKKLKKLNVLALVAYRLHIPQDLGRYWNSFRTNDLTGEPASRKVET